MPANTGSRGADRRCHLHPRKTSRSRRPSDSWPLGRRSAEWWKEQLRCDASGAAFTFSHADQGAEPRHGGGRGGLEQTRSQTSGNPGPLADVGSRTRDGEAQGVYGSHGCAGLLLRSAESLAAWDPSADLLDETGRTRTSNPLLKRLSKNNSLTNQQYASRSLLPTTPA